MNNQRLMELAGVRGKQLNEQSGNLIAAVYDVGDTEVRRDPEFLGLVGPFRSTEEANQFFEQLDDGSLDYEIEAPQSPQQFAQQFQG